MAASKANQLQLPPRRLRGNTISRENINDMQVIIIPLRNRKRELLTEKTSEKFNPLVSFVRRKKETLLCT